MDSLAPEHAVQHTHNPPMCLFRRLRPAARIPDQARDKGGMSSTGGNCLRRRQKRRQLRRPAARQLAARKQQLLPMDTSCNNLHHPSKASSKVCQHWYPISRAVP